LGTGGFFLSRRVNRRGREANTSGAEVKDAWSHVSTPTLGVMASYIDKTTIRYSNVQRNVGKINYVIF
jgi:hypothetical protein